MIVDLGYYSYLTPLFFWQVDEVDAKSSNSIKGKKPITKKVMEYCYEPQMEEVYVMVDIGSAILYTHTHVPCVYWIPRDIVFWVSW